MMKIAGLYIFVIFPFFAGHVCSFSTKDACWCIKDAHSDEPVVFASIKFINSSIGKLSDSSGTFVFNLAHWPSDTLEITCVGYQPHKLFIPAGSDSIAVEITMERGTFNEGVKVKTKVNKGLFLWRKIVQNKARNDKFRFKNFL
jgi:hypothetical protein